MTPHRLSFATKAILGGIGAALLALSLVPTGTHAAAFAHPSRVAALGGAIPEATVRGAVAFRIALAAGAVAIPLLAAMLLRAAGPASQRPTSPWKHDRQARLALGAVIAVGALVRILLARQSFWYDEISSFLSFAIEGPGVAFGSYVVPTNHVPMTLAVWAVWRATGSSDELLLRLPALAAGIASIPTAALLAERLLGRRALLPGALVMALAPIPILASTEARGYAFVILAALVGALAIARAREGGSSAAWIAFATAAAIGAWSHPVALALPIAAVAVGLASRRDRALAIAGTLSLAIAAVLLAPLSGDVLSTRSDYLRSEATQPSLLSRETCEAALGLALAWSGPWRMPDPVLVPLALLGAFAILRGRSHRLRDARIVLAPFALAIAVALAAQAALGTWTYARFYLFATPIGAILVTLGILDASRRCRRPWIARGAPALLVLSTAFAATTYLAKQPIREAVATVAARREDGDRVATIGLPDNAVGFYALRAGFEAIPTGFLGSDLDGTLAREDPRFVIALYPDRLSPETLARLDRTFDRTGRLAGWADWGHGAVEVWEASRRGGDQPTGRSR